MRTTLLLSALLCLISFSAHAGFKFTLVSYNVENLFDNVHDANKDDEDYTPGGKANWTDERLNLKLEQVATAIRAINNGKGPDVITLAEVENINVLTMLNKKLAGLKYIPVLVEGPDRRGIDMALLTRFPLARQVHKYQVDIPGERKTRPVYDVVLQLTPTTKFGILMNHWPARMSPPVFRCVAGDTLKKVFQIHLERDPDIDYVASGDFNDEPEDASLSTCLSTGTFQQVMSSYPARPKFFDLYLEKYLPRDKRGTYYFGKEKQWNAIDHIILAKGLFDNKNVRYVPGSFSNIKMYGVNVLRRDIKTPEGYLLPAGTPVKFMTFGAPGSLKAIGVSDHLPIKAEFEVLD